MWGVENGYWWPLLGFMTLGFLLCVLSGYKPTNSDTKEPLTFRNSPISLLMRCILMTIGGIAAIFLLELLVIGLYYTFFTEYIKIIVPVGAAAGIVGFLFFIGWRYYKDNGHKK